MIVAVCMINVELGKETNVRRVLSMFEGVRELIHLFGEYDFIVIIETDSLKYVKDIVYKIRKIEGVTSTRTIIGAET